MIHNNFHSSRVLLALVFTFILLTSFKQIATASPRVLQTADVLLYDDALQNGFASWSFDTTLNFTNTSPTYNASADSIRVAYNSGNWGALWLVHPSGNIALTDYTALRFAIHGGTSGGQTLSVQADAGTNYPNNSVDLNTFLSGGPVANQWSVVTIPLSALNLSGGSLGSVAFQSNVNTGQTTFYIDDIRLVASTAPPVTSANIHIDSSAAATAVDARLFSSNLPAWVGPNFANVTLRARTSASGVSMLRIPGGSWSDDYGWLSCEMGANQSGAYPCGSGWESWAARPTDFINFIRATNKQPMYTMNVNVTSKEAAAAVAFFNSYITNTTSIGVDIHGTNWYTAGHWAQLRVDHGNATPLGIQYWEFGNEIYGGDPQYGGANCVSYGWEHTWTCDGAEYVNGISGHEGYLAFRNAMRAVDPTILVGAVGTENPSDFTNWGNKVLAAAGSVMDFYIVHPYAYFTPPPNTPSGYAQILAQPEINWSQIKTNLRNAFNANAHGRQIPVAATEYNLVSVQEQDTNQLMTRAVNALFIADSIGQAMQSGFAMANQWDLTNGCASNGTCYDLLQVDHSFARSPQYYAFPLWSRFGNEMLPVTSTVSASSQLSVYAGRVSPSTLSLLAINKTSSAITGTISFDAGVNVVSGTADEVKAATLGATSVTLNNVTNPSDDLSNAPPFTLSNIGSSIVYTFAPNSITLLRMNTSGAPPPIFLPIFLPLILR